MKKLILPSILALLLLATAPYNYANSTTVPNESGEHNSIAGLIDNLPNYYVGEEEKEAPMEFNVAAYLPESFDVYKGMIVDESYALTEEAIPFSFDLNNYLPEQFDAYKGMITNELYALTEEAIPFTFDLNEFLPGDFDAYEGMIIEEELEEVEIPFDFNVEDYLPINFDAHACHKEVISM